LTDQKKSVCTCTTDYGNGKNNRKVSKIIARRKRTNQYGDETEERRRKKKQPKMPMDNKFKKQCVVNLSKKGRK
jgi:hypothetical protein